MGYDREYGGEERKPKPETKGGECRRIKNIVLSMCSLLQETSEVKKNYMTR